MIIHIGMAHQPFTWGNSPVPPASKLYGGPVPRPAAGPLPLVIVFLPPPPPPRPAPPASPHLAPCRQVSINLWLVVRMYAAFMPPNVLALNTAYDSATRLSIFVHYLCKALDFMDTAFIILRKKVGAHA